MVSARADALKAAFAALATHLPRASSDPTDHHNVLIRSLDGARRRRRDLVARPTSSVELVETVDIFTAPIVDEVAYALRATDRRIAAGERC